MLLGAQYKNVAPSNVLYREPLDKNPNVFFFYPFPPSLSIHAAPPSALLWPRPRPAPSQVPSGSSYNRCPPLPLPTAAAAPLLSIFVAPLTTPCPTPALPRPLPSPPRPCPQSSPTIPTSSCGSPPSLRCSSRAVRFPASPPSLEATTLLAKGRSTARLLAGGGAPKINREETGKGILVIKI